MADKLLKNIDLNGHSYEIDAKYLGGKNISDIENYVKITYAELKSLRDSSKLIPGKQYRITDYITSTTQKYTISAGHQFDIIVTADDINRLNEKARAIQHEGDTYFANSDLNAWQIWYFLDNDRDRFSWANTTSGRGVIYRMIDEFDNDCPYDFKNIQFARWELSNPVGYRNDYDFDNSEDNWIQELTQFDSLKTGFYGLSSSDNVFYYGKDNDYDYNKYKVEYTISKSPTYCYTFGNGTDYSISGSNYGNVIKERGIGVHIVNNNKISLNNIVFLSDSCFGNSFGYWCSDISFGNGCHSNSFGDYCSDNSFGNTCYSNSFSYYCNNNSFGSACSSNSFSDHCSSNSFGDYCHNNSFGSDCYYNSFGNICRSNSFGNTCSYNSFGNTCHNNSFGSACSSNSFGNTCEANSFGYSCSGNSFGYSCSSNSFGDYCCYNSFGYSCSDNSFGNDCNSNSFGNTCQSNSFGKWCSGNSFGNNCSYNSFGNTCHNNSFGNSCCYNSFGNTCHNNSFGSACSSNSFGNSCCYNSFGESRNSLKSYYCYIIFENGNSNINLNCTATTGSTNKFQNVRIALGVNNTGIYLTINDSNVNQAYETVYGKIIVANQKYMRDESL